MRLGLLTVVRPHGMRTGNGLVPPFRKSRSSSAGSSNSLESVPAARGRSALCSDLPAPTSSFSESRPAHVGFTVLSSGACTVFGSTTEPSPMYAGADVSREDIKAALEGFGVEFIDFKRGVDVPLRCTRTRRRDGAHSSSVLIDKSE